MAYPSVTDRDKIRLAELTIELQRQRINELQRALEDAIYVRRQLAREAFVFPVKAAKCPNCGREELFGMMLYDENHRHQHTRYFCRAWGNGACDWRGWTC